MPFDPPLNPLPGGYSPSNQEYAPPPRDGVVAGSAKYPGLPPVINMTYTVSHGISPGVIVLRTQEGRREPDGRGDLTITDGRRTFELRDCRVDEFTTERIGGTGTEWIIKLSDERWKWEYTTITGWYNQLDDNAKLIPSTVRSPTELAELCLRAMNVDTYSIDMPPGVTSDDAKTMPDLLVAGINFPAIGINPACDWYGDNAATVLAQLCDQCGRRLVYDPIARVVHIVRAGIGAELPPGSINMQQLTLTSPDTPDVVTVLGSPTRWQAMFPLQAVGEDWDGQIKPINFLSYAPLGDPTYHKVKVTCTSVADKSPELGGGKPELTIELMQPDERATAAEGAVISVRATYQVLDTDTPLDVAANLMGLLSGALPRDGLGPFAFATGPDYGEFTITHTVANKPFEVSISGTSYQWLTAEVVEAGSPGQVTWKYCAPPLFMGVRATSQLTMEQARALAQKTVFRMYRIDGTDVSTGKPPLFVPGYGEVKKRQYILLEPDQVEQVVPESGDADFIDVNDEPLIQNLYNGYSRNKAAAVYGSVAVEIFDSSYIGDGGLPVDGWFGSSGGEDLERDNTRPNELVPIPFSVDAKNQSILFSNHVYKFTSDGCIDAADGLVLKTACTVRNDHDQQLRGYTESRVIREGGLIRPKPGVNLTGSTPRPGTGGTRPSNATVGVSLYEREPNGTNMVVRRPDVQLNVYGVYKYDERKTRWVLSFPEILEADAIVRARYYLDAALIQLQLKPGLVQKYNGLIPIRMDGRIMQVTYEFRGGEGCSTLVSLNAEHDVWTLPYPARRREENLAFVDRVVPPGARNLMKEGPTMFRATNG